MDLQLLTGLVLYFFLSPITKLAMSDFGAAMKNSDLRFYAVEHFAMMLIAVVLVHIGRAKSKKAKTDQGKFKIASIFFLIASIIMVVSIPWSRL
jgi:predicted membrane channel-forming protein YqfA (hemolysin III family)